MSRFWSGGSAAYLKALIEEEKEALERLRSALKDETDPKVIESLEMEIVEVHFEFSKRRREVSIGIF